MSCEKYGRLFTEADVLAIVDEALMAGLGRSAEVGTMHEILEVLIRRAEADKAPMRFPADEPLFLLRGQDCSAPDAIAPMKELLESFRWDYWLSAKDDGASAELLEQVQAAATAMREWQAANPDRVKVPD